MDQTHIKSKLVELRKQTQERKFAQTFDLIVNLQSMDLKKPEHKVDFGVTLNSPVRSKKIKICAVVDQSISGAEDVFDRVVYASELQDLKGDMKKIREITHGFDKFVVQANMMAQFAQVLGRYLGPMNKMPSPKLGMVISDKTPLQPLYDKLQKTAHFQTRKNLVLQASMGSEKESDDVIAENIAHAYDALIHALPNQQNNVKNISVKLTMGKKVEL